MSSRGRKHAGRRWGQRTWCGTDYLFGLCLWCRRMGLAGTQQLRGWPSPMLRLLLPLLLQLQP